MPNVENHRLIALRKQCNLTQEQLGAKVGMSQAMVARIESGDRDPGKRYKINLAEFFGVTVEYLFYEQFYTK